MGNYLFNVKFLFCYFSKFNIFYNSLTGRLLLSKYQLHDLKFDSDKFTLEAWIKIENGPSSGSKDYIFRKKNDWSLAIENINGSLYLEGRFRRDYHGNWPEIVSTQTVSTGTWYHVAFTNSRSSQ